MYQFQPQGNGKWISSNLKGKENVLIPTSKEREMYQFQPQGKGKCINSSLEGKENGSVPTSRERKMDQFQPSRERKMDQFQPQGNGKCIYFTENYKYVNTCHARIVTTVFFVI